MAEWASLLADPGSLGQIPGTDESIAAATASIGGHPSALVWCDFDVAAGTLSVAAGRRFVEALDFAVEHSLPVIAVANSGGARMQEGTVAFMQMLGCVAAVRRVRGARLPFILYLAGPTTGGVFASWASLGHFTFAEPGAMIGFIGPRIADALGEPIEPASIQTAERLAESGLVDEVVARPALRQKVIDILGALRSERAPVDASVNDAARVASDHTAEPPTGWSAVVASRDPSRSVVLDDILAGCSNVTEIRGDRVGGLDHDVLTALCALGPSQIPAMLIAHRRVDGRLPRPTVAGLRSAIRAMSIAEELGVMVVTVIDTPGATIGADQEASGFAGAIAQSIDTMSGLSVPSLAVVAGSGSGGAAMAWLCADSVIAADDAWVAPIAPEAGSLIVHRTADRASEIADTQRVSATEMMVDGLLDEVFPVTELAVATFEAAARIGVDLPDVIAERL